MSVNPLPVSYPEYVTVDMQYLYNNKESKVLSWEGKVWCAYGDSITTYADYPVGKGWGDYVNNAIKFKRLYERGIGGTPYQYGSHGSFVSFVTDSGELYNSDMTHNKDNYSGTIPSGCVAIRSSFCSWDRITHMIPNSIRENIDMLFVMGGTNGDNTVDEAVFIENDETDVEWKTSDFYSLIGGDYNINTLAGAMTSCLMKLQLWCPNAVIIVGTPLSGRGTQGQIRTDIKNQEYLTSKVIRDVANALSFPICDMNAECLINGWNAKDLLGDGTHPTNEKSKKMMARVLIGRLRTILPMIN